MGGRITDITNRGPVGFTALYRFQNAQKAPRMELARHGAHPPEAFHRGDYHRLRAGPYRVVYVVDDDLITIERVDRITRA